MRIANSHCQRSVLGSELYRSYREWCNRNYEQPLSIQSFGKELREKDLTSHKTNKGNLWTGLRLIDLDTYDDFDDFYGNRDPDGFVISTAQLPADFHVDDDPLSEVNDDADGEDLPPEEGA